MAGRRSAEQRAAAETHRSSNSLWLRRGCLRIRSCSCSRLLQSRLTESVKHHCPSRGRCRRVGESFIMRTQQGKVRTVGIRWRNVQASP